METDATLRVALAQIDTTVGDIAGNAALVREWTARAAAVEAQVVVFPELTITGYPAEDLWLRPHFLAAARQELEGLAAETDGIVALVGFAEAGPPARNAVAVLAGGTIAAVYRKILLPNYGVFDERRYFEAGTEPVLVDVGGVRVGLTICEDIWFPGPPASTEAEAGAALIVNPSASPYHRGKGIAREEMIRQRARETGAAFAVCNLVGGQDELVFDGHSVVVSPAGEVLARAPQFAEALVVCDVPLARGSADPAVVPAASLDVPPPRGVAEATIAEVLGPVAEVYGALVLGLRDYVEKNGFERVLVGVSGGVDSALVATVAADALGPDRVACAVMPSPHSSEATQADARTLVANLGAELLEFPIEPAMRAYEVMLDGGTGPPDRGEHGTAVGTGGRTTASDLAAENIQARIRGNVLMAISNRRGWLVLTTGNKSEMSVGYATLYGDMAGGFAVIKDVPKTLVYELCRYRNSLEPGGGPIPEAILGRAPSAELRPDQRDEDSLPPYAVLDPILEAYVEEDRSRDEIVAAGADPEVVDEVLAMVDRAEYKRRQAPPGVKITPRAFGRDRRLPITNRFRG